jgi:SAM-dependent methyltransferase
VETALEKAERSFPRFRDSIRGKVVLDYGSGFGYQAIAMVHAGAKHVVGLDIMEIAKTTGEKLAAEHGVTDRTTFITCPAELTSKVDVVLSQNSFEHYPDPQRELNTMASMLAAGGRAFICFGPPWYAPRGSHMAYFCRLPWVNVLFPESTVMSVRSQYRDDGAKHYVDVPGGLNMMSIAKWEGLIRSTGLKAEYSHYHAVKNISFLSRIPGLRELMINDVAAVLVRPNN